MDGKFFQRILRNQYLFLLASLLLILCVLPLIDNRLGQVRILHYVSLALVFVTGVYANRAHRSAFITGSVITILAVPTLTWSVVMRSGAPTISAIVIICCYCVAMAVLILISVFRDAERISDAILGAICSYLLLGLCWSFLYMAAVQTDAEAIRITTGTKLDFLTPHSPFADYVYFSFVTMSTLGYGDMVPLTAFAKTLAWLQALVGQFYLAALVARLVGAIPSKAAGENASKDPSK